NVLLPQPEGPMIDTTSPALTLVLTPLSTDSSP
ncbi:MAG: cupin, partial [Betaproteobacteria bacterium]|nr:cupin [Betaproteobacteria bacterium]